MKKAKPRKTQVVVRVGDDVKSALDTIKARDGVTIQHQINAALAAWVKARGGSAE